MLKCQSGNSKKLCTIYWSSLKRIYENLALEEWLFRNHDLESGGDLILFWSNMPTVVVGRHQNPFLEANVPFLKEKRIDLARRHSGGGTVFHGLGNLNVSILTSQKDHCRPRNLQWIATTLNETFRTEVIATKRDDLIFPDERKISGTAARIARNRAYHHLTLLIDEDLTLLRKSLQSPFKDLIETNATKSVPAKHVGQLSQEIPGITVEKVQNLLIESFAKNFYESKRVKVDHLNDRLYPGIAANLSELLSWEWIWAKTPKFVFNKTVRVENGIVVDCESSKFKVGEKFSV
uniref:BPL/LPL catalytic domain-containing protein n=1 Tax=Panagrolaimus sp. JU765 TaxID=591449 RepID=A0AC34QN83_9BILA